MNINEIYGSVIGHLISIILDSALIARTLPFLAIRLRFDDHDEASRKETNGSLGALVHFFIEIDAPCFSCHGVMVHIEFSMN